MPEPAVAHDADHALAEGRRDGGRARQAEAVTEHRIAEVEGRQGRHRVAAHIGGDMDSTEVALNQFEGGENRALRTAGAKRRRPLRDRLAEQFRGLFLERRVAERAGVPLTSLPFTVGGTDDAKTFGDFYRSSVQRMLDALAGNDRS